MTIQLSTINLEKNLQRSLPYFFALVLFTTIAGVLSLYLEHEPWTMGDWLINYQGGMVRRGFLGEMIYKLAHFTHINPGLYVVAFQIFFYAVFFLFSYLLLRKERALLPYVLLIFSPFIFTFQINDLLGGFRKEIIYFALLAFIVWSAKLKEYRTFEKIFYTALLLYPAVILTHEMSAIFLPYLLVVYISVSNLNRGKFFLIILLLLPSIASFLMTIYYSGTALQVTEIFNSIARENYTITGGAISWLDKDLSFGLRSVLGEIRTNQYLFYYPLFIGLSVLAYIPVYKKLKVIFENKLSVFLVFLSVFGSVAIFAVAVDWGRFIYIHLVSIFCLSLIPVKSKVIIFNERYHQSTNLVRIFAIAFFIIYSLFWYIPHCCKEISNKQVNISAFIRPYEKIVLYFAPNLKSFLK